MKIEYYNALKYNSIDAETSQSELKSENRKSVTYFNITVLD